MVPSLRVRLGLSRGDQTATEARTDTAAMARSLMYVFLAGGTIVLLSLALTGEPGADHHRVLVTGLSAYAIAIALLLGYDRLPPWAFPLFLACATMLIEWTILASGDTTSPYAMFYFWIAIYAFYFFSRRQAVLQIVFIALASATVFAHDMDSTAVVRWVITSSALVVAGALIGVLKDHVDRLAQAARVDHLTGLLNRRAFHDIFEGDLERATRSGTPLSVIVCDLDGFKRVNDREGHAAGDAVLHRAANLIGLTARRMDRVARMAGEEFAIVVPDADEHGGYVLAERLRQRMRDALAGDAVPLTLSLGVATYPDHAATAQGLLHAADQALYAAKELGRDRSVIYNRDIARTLVAAGAREETRDQGVAAVLALAEVLDLRDAGTAAHSQTVGRYARGIARELGLPGEQVSRAHLAGILHDVGKIAVPDSVLRKPGPLTESEWKRMRQHPEIGSLILDGANLADIGAWVLAHHERPDGRGYPHGLSDDEIPVEAKILAVADSYEAMTAGRVYRAAISTEEAREELLRCAGSQFDAAVVHAFLRMLDRDGAAAPPVADPGESEPSAAYAGEG